MLSLLTGARPAVLAAGPALIISFLCFLLLCEVLGPVSVPHFLALHSLLEVAAIATSCLVASVAWAARPARPEKYFVVLAFGFLGAALLDTSHLLSFEGMPDYITSNSLGKSIGFWLAARYLAALSLLAFVVLLRARKSEQVADDDGLFRKALLAGLLVLLAFIHVIVFWFPELIPPFFVPGSGLTRFKVIAEAGVVVVLLLAAGILLGMRPKTVGFDRSLLLSALLAGGLGEVLVSLYNQPDDLYILGGHFYRLLSVLILFRATFSESVSRPYALLRASEAHLKAVLDAVPDFMCEVDEGGVVRSVHASRPELLPAPPQQLIGRNLEELLPERSAAACMDALRKAARAGYAQGRQITVPLADGEHVYELSIARKREAQAQGLRFIVLSRDITQRLQSDAALRELKLAVEQSPSTIMITDLHSRLQYANQAFVQSTGYSLKEALGRTPSILHSGKNSPQTYEDMWKSLRQGKAWRGELLNQRKDGAHYLESVLISPVTDEAGKVTSYLAVKDDITQQRLDQKTIAQLSNYDALTGLPNRSLFGARFTRMLAQGTRPSHRIAVLSVKLDRFTQVNDSLGYGVGDELLVEIAGRLRYAARESGLVSRLSGDEFVLVLPFTDLKSMTGAAEALRAHIQQPCRIGAYNLVVTASIGIALAPDDGDTLEPLLQAASTAAFQAKTEGRNALRFFSSEMQGRSARLLQLENALRTAVDREELSLVYQPQVCLATREVVGVEALLRWHHPELGSVGPAEFIPVAENSGQIVEIGGWVLRSAVNQAVQWQAQGLPTMVMAVNLSLQQFRHDDLLADLDELLLQTGFPANCLELELTESITMDDPEQAARIVKSLRERGVMLSIDDFGTGYSSLSYLKRLALNKLKIDKSFIDGIAQDGADASIVTAIIGMARSLGMVTISEGVESSEQLAVLQEMGCDEVQGYVFSKPLPPAAIVEYLREAAA